MQKIIRKKLKNKPITSVNMKTLDCSQEVLNELLQFIVNLISAEGLTQLKFSEFIAKVEMDTSILE